jgi:hypothetical protein
VGVDVRLHDCCSKGLPIGGPQLSKLGDDLKAVQGIPICAAVDGLDLEEGIFFIEFDWDVGPSQPDVCKQWSKPSVGLNNAFVVLVPLTAC